MDIILDHKWLVLALLEVLAWSSTFFMLIARYRIGSRPMFLVGAALTVATGVIPQVVLGILNFIAERKLDVFTFVIVLLILYGSTLGRKKIKQLDNWASVKFARKGKREA